MIAARRRWLGLIGAGLAGWAAAPAAAATRRDPDAVYDLVDVGKAAFVLGALRNHLAGAEGPPKLAVVIHGPAMKSFVRAEAQPEIVHDAAERMKSGVVFYACVNTLAGLGLKLEELLPGFALAERGGVVKLAELQGQGWVYLRP